MRRPPADVGSATQAVLDQGIDPLTPQSPPASLLATLAQLRPGRLGRIPPLQREHGFQACAARAASAA